MFAPVKGVDIQLRLPKVLIMSMLRKIFISGVMMVTVLSLSVGVVGANKASAAASAGDLIKVNGVSSVYYLAANGKKYVFPNEATYFSWYKDFSGVITIPQSEMDGYGLPVGNVTMRPGTKLVKSPSVSTVYAVEPGGVLRSIVSEANAISLWGANWAKMVVDIPDSFITNYNPNGTALPLGQYPVGQLIKTAGSPNVMLIAADGTARPFASQAAFDANNYNFNYVATVPSTYVMPTTGATINGVESTLSDVSQGGTATGPVATGSGLSVALSSDTPSSQTIPAGVSRIELLRFNVTAANDGDVLLNAVTITRSALGNNSDFSSLWVEQAGARLSSTKSINSTNQAIITLSPALDIPAGKTITLSVYGAVSASVSGANDILSIAAASDVMTSGATVSGSFPISSNLMSFTTGYKVNQALITAPNNGANALNVGDEDVVLASMNIADKAGLSDTVTRDLVLKSITLKNSGNAELATVVSNLALEKSGVMVSEPSPTVNGKYVTFTLANGGLTISKGDDITIKVTGDIITEDSSNNVVQLMLNKNSDMDVEEAASGYSATVSTNSGTGLFDNSLATFEDTTLGAGDLTIAKDATSPTQKSYVKNSKDVVVLLANVNANQAFTADGMKLNIHSQSNATDFSNVRLYVNNILVDSKDIDGTATSSGYLNYDSSVDINAGNNVIKVLMDVNSDATDGSYVTLELNSANAFTNPVYVANDNDVTGITGVATAGKVTVSTAGLTATRSDGFADADKIVAGSADATLGTFTLQAQNDDITVNSISLTGNIGAATKLSESDVTNLKIMVGGAQIGPAKNLTASGASFNLGADKFVIAQGTTKVITLVGSIDSNSTANYRLETTLSVNGTDSNGKDLLTTPSANTVDFTIAGSGTLTTVKDGNARVSALLAANSGSNEVASFKLTASNDAIKINKIYISNVKGNGSDSRIAAIDLYNGSTLLGTAVPTNGQVMYDISSNPVAIPSASSVTLTAKVELTNITSSAQSGKEIQLAITGIEADSSSGAELTKTGNVFAFDDDVASFTNTHTSSTAMSLGTASTTLGVGTYALAVGDVIQIGNEQMLVTSVIVPTTQFGVTRGINGTTAVVHSAAANVYVLNHGSDIYANDFIVRKTIPTIALTALPNTLLTVGNQTVLKFTVSADQNSDVTINSFVASTSINGASTTDAVSGSIKVNGTNYVATSTAGKTVITENASNAQTSNSTASPTTKIVVDVHNTPIVVSAGTSKTIEVILPISKITTTNGATASITTHLGQDATAITPASIFDVNSSTFLWSDNADVTNYASTLTGSFEVQVLPTDTQSLTSN